MLTYNNEFCEVATIPEIEVIHQEQTSDVDPYDVDSVVIHPPQGDAWRLISLKVSVDPVDKATRGYHEIKIRGETDYPEYFRYQSNYFSQVEVERGTIQSADRIREPKEDEVLCTTLQGVELDSSEGIELYYSNDTDETQTNNRDWRLRFHEY